MAVCIASISGEVECVRLSLIYHLSLACRAGIYSQVLKVLPPCECERRMCKAQGERLVSARMAALVLLTQCGTSWGDLLKIAEGAAALRMCKLPGGGLVPCARAVAVRHWEADLPPPAVSPFQFLNLFLGG